MKLNHFICPNCGHDFYASGGYAMCDACFCVFYASESRTCRFMTNQVLPTPTPWKPSYTMITGEGGKP